MLQPGQRYSATTYVSHQWRVRSEKTGLLIKTVAVESTTKNVVIAPSDVRALLTQGASPSPTEKAAVLPTSLPKPPTPPKEPQAEREKREKALELARTGPPVGFVFYNGNKLADPAMRRIWNRVDDGTWEEREPNGHVTTLRVVGRSSIEGISGTHLRKLSDPNQEVFLPDKGSYSTRLLWRQSSGDWTYIGDIRDVK